MGKQARLARQRREAFERRYPLETALAGRAHELLDAVWSELTEEVRRYTQTVRFRQGQLRRVESVRLTPATVDRQRRNCMTQGLTWPDWCFMPAGAAMVSLADSCGWGRDEDIVLPISNVAAAVAGVAAWHAAPLVARFDDDLADAVMATPLTGEIPFDSLRRLPTWAVMIPVDWLRAGSMALVWVDAGRVTSAHGNESGNETYDEMLVMLCGDHPPITLRLRFSETTIAESLRAQTADLLHADITPLAGTAAIDQAITAHFGDVTAEIVLAKICALVLYLSSQQSDVSTNVTVEAPTRQRRASPSAADTAVIDVGFRIGAALRAHRARAASNEQSAPTGIRQAPHIRAAHWHTYWYGPRADPDARYRATRWLPPINVNIDLDDPVPTTVRSVLNEESGRLDRGLAGNGGAVD